MKTQKQKKNVSLPVGNKDIFEALGEIAFSVEDDKGGLDRDDFINDVVQELGKDAFLYSFTPSGEIGDGHNTKQNPQTPRVAHSFYDGFRDMLGVKGEGSATDGKVVKMLKQNTNSDRVINTRVIRFKGAVINLVQLYLESALSLVPTDKNTYKQKKNKESVKRERITSFNYKKRPAGMTDTDWIDYLISVEENRYMRMFIATIFFKTISELFLVSSTQVYKTIKAQNLLGVEGLSQKKKFGKLRQPATRTTFVQLVRELWNLELQPLPSKKKKGGTPRSQGEMDLEE